MACCSAPPCSSVTASQGVPVDEYQQTIRALSDRIVVAQTPIRILDAVKWDENVRKEFLAAKGKALPAVDRAYYENRPLGFDSSALKQEFQNIER
ncbi:hypothetical protein ALQ56_04657, partial [Pseudomonas syringae pv. papulans]